MRLIHPTAYIMPNSHNYHQAMVIIAEASAQCYNKKLPDDFSDMEEYVRKRIKSGHESISDIGSALSHRNQRDTVIMMANGKEPKSNSSFRYGARRSSQECIEKRKN